MTTERWTTAHAMEVAIESARLQAIEEAIGDFEVAVWRRWLQAYYKASPERGHCARAGAIEMLVWGAAGRVMITLGGPGADVTILAPEDGDQHPGLQGIDARPSDAAEMVRGAATMSEELRRSIRPDDSVRVAGL